MGTQIGQLPIPRTGVVSNDLIALIICEDVFLGQALFPTISLPS